MVTSKVINNKAMELIKKYNLPLTKEDISNFMFEKIGIKNGFATYCLDEGNISYSLDKIGNIIIGMED